MQTSAGGHPRQMLCGRALCHLAASHMKETGGPWPSVRRGFWLTIHLLNTRGRYDLAERALRADALLPHLEYKDDAVPDLVAFFGFCFYHRLR